MDGTIRVLLVDDEPEFANVVAALLEHEDDRLDVVVESDARDGLARLRSESIDCVVSDYDMPEMNGLAFLDAVRADFPDLPFLLFTGKGSEEIASRAISAGVTDYFQKGSGDDQYRVLANRITNAVGRRRSQHALAESTRRLSLFVDRSAVAAIEWTDSLEVAWANDAARELLGYSAGELVGEAWETILPEADRAATATRADESVDQDGEQGTRQLVTETATADGERIVCEWHNRVVTDDDDRLAVVSQFQDVAGHRRYERAVDALRDLSGDLEELDDVETAARRTLDTALAIVDAEAGALLLEDDGVVRVQATAGPVPVDDASTAGIDDAASTDDERDLLDPAGRYPSRLEQSLGDTGRLLAYSSAVDAFDERDRELLDLLAGLAGATLARIEVETERRETTRLLDQLFEQVPVHLFMKDEAGRHVRVSEHLVGDTDEHLGHTDFAVAPDTFAEETYADDMEVVETGDPIIDKEEFSEVSNAWALTSKVPWYGEDGDVRGVIGVSRRITKRKEYEQELERQNERLDRFAEVVSHDLRNPLAVATGRLELLERDCESPHIEPIEHALDRMEQFLDDLLLLSRRGDIIDDPEPVDLAAVVDQCRRTVTTGNATVRCETSATIQADPARLAQVLENLLDNAIAHGGDDVTVEIGVLEDADGFYVEDDGPGIPDDRRDRAFEAGYTSSDDGTGLGLSIVRDVVEAHDWAIEVTEGSDGGARFEITGVELDR